MEVGRLLGGDRVGELLRRRWRWRAVEEGMEVGSY